MLFKGPLLRQRVKERQEYEERMRPQREREARAREYEARIQQRREYDARVQKWREYEARVQEGKEPVVYWIREKARAIASTVAKMKSDARAREYKAQIQQRREYDARVQKWREYEARVQEGKEPVVYWIREKARAIASTVAKIQSDFSQISFGSPRQPTSSSVRSPLTLLYLSSRPSFQPEPQTQSAPVEPNTEDQTRPTILKQSPQPSFATGILKKFYLALPTCIRKSSSSRKSMLNSRGL